MSKLITQSLGLADKHGEGPNRHKFGMLDHQHRKTSHFPLHETQAYGKCLGGEERQEQDIDTH